MCRISADYALQKGSRVFSLIFLDLILVLRNLKLYFGHFKISRTIVEFKGAFFRLL